MKDIEKATLVEQELKTLTEKIDKLEESVRDLKDLQLEIKGLKVFLGRVYPDFKTGFPDIIRKLKD